MGPEIAARLRTELAAIPIPTPRTRGLPAMDLIAFAECTASSTFWIVTVDPSPPPA